MQKFVHHPCLSIRYTRYTFPLLYSSIRKISTALSESVRKDSDSILPTTKREKPSERKFKIIHFNKDMNEVFEKGEIEKGVKLFQAHLALKDRPVDVITFNTVISHLTKNGFMNTALHIFDQMKIRKVNPDKVTFGLLLNGFAKMGDLKMVAQTLEMMRNYRIQPSDKEVDNILSAMCNAGKVEGAREIFDNLPKLGYTQSKFNFFPLIKMYSEKGDLDEAVKLVKRMIDENISMGDDEMIGAPFTYLVNGFIKYNKPHEARMVLKMINECGKIPQEKLVHDLIDGLVSLGAKEELYQLLDDMDNDIHLYIVAMKSYFNKQDGASALDLFDRLVDKSIKVNEKVFQTLIDGFIILNNFEQVVAIVEYMFQQNIPLSVPIYTSVIKGYIKANKPESAVTIYNSLLDSDLELSNYVFNAIIPAFDNTGDIDSAKKVIIEMKNRNIEPDIVTFTSLMRLCCRRGLLTEAKDIFLKMKDAGIKPNTISYSVLVEGISKYGDIKDAMELVREMREQNIPRDTIIYCSLLKGFQPGENVTEVAQWIQEDGIELDQPTKDLLVKLVALCI